ncbi:hypothetical protein KAZ82_00275, partial [Candidatus Babeliales bacterium]|nr:hypothetical protein [Candidatus Babeliales bacterium]
MRQPLWAINSSLILLCILGQLVFVIIQKPILRRASLEPDSVNLTEHKSTVMVDIKKIYEANDLFATYTPAPTPTYTEPEIPPIPNAPTLIPLSIPAETPRVFIPPLPVTLKGVIYSHDK